MTPKRGKHRPAEGPLAAFGRLEEVRPARVERIRQQGFDVEHTERMHRAAISQHDPTPAPEQPIDGLGGLVEGDATVAEDCDSLPTLQVDGPNPVVDEVSKRAAGELRSRLVQVDDETTTGAGGQPERGDVVQERIARTNREDPMDEVSLRHEPERTKPDRT